MSFTAPPQNTWTRADSRPERAALPGASAEQRPATPAFMARRRQDVLSQTIRTEIVPRLILARGAEAQLAVSELNRADGEDVQSLADLVLRRDVSEATAFVEGVTARGVAVDSIYLDLLAPTARRLGSLWDEDLLDFGRVTIGLGRLHQVLGGLSTPFQDDARRQTRKPRILLVPAPGDSHSFGMAMVASFFQRAGWSGWSGVPEDVPALVAMVRAESFAVIGFSASCTRRMDALSVAIRAVRRGSLNQDVRIMVGGPLFVEHPELVAMVGADATASDGRQAVLQAQNLLSLIPIRA